MDQPATSPDGSPYSRALDAGRDALRLAVVQAAAELLGTYGPEGLTMRRIADRVGASTTVLYRNFTNKNGLIDALVRAGLELLASRLRAIDEAAPPLERLRRAAWVYRAVALEHPTRYPLLFASTVAGYEPGPAAAAAAADSLAAFVDIVRACADAGHLTSSAEPAFIAEVLTAAAHGAVSLELSGQFSGGEQGEKRFATLTAAAVAPFLTVPRP